MSGTGAAEAAAISQMRRQRGTAVTLRRLVSGGPPIDVTVMATIMGYQVNEFVGGIVQGDRRAKISDDDIAVAAWPGPPRRGDQIIANGRTFTVQACDTATMGASVLSHTMQITGAS